MEIHRQIPSESCCQPAWRDAESLEIEMSKLHQWCIALSLWGLVMYIVAPATVVAIGWIPLGFIGLLGSIFLFLLCLFAAWMIAARLEEKYGD